MRLWTPAEVQKREQQLVAMCARIAVEYGPQHPFQSSTTAANGIARAIEAFGRMVMDEWAADEEAR